SAIPAHAGDGRPRSRAKRTRPCSGRRAGPSPSSRTSTDSQSPATHCAPGLACPTRPPPSCCASSALTRPREPHAPPDLHRLRQGQAPDLAVGGLRMFSQQCVLEREVDLATTRPSRRLCAVTIPAVVAHVPGWLRVFPGVPPRIALRLSARL